MHSALNFSALDVVQVDPGALCTAFTRRTLMASGERVTSLLTDAQHTDVKDAFVKGLYGRLFVWLVAKLNRVVDRQGVAERERIGVGPAPAGARERGRSIGFLDIYGFESFLLNR